MDREQLLKKIEEITRSGDDNDTLLTKVMVAIHDSNPAYYWVGIYRLEGDLLHLGPYSGPATDHVEIPVGRGVCGTAVLLEEDQIVADVSSLDNYLACNIHTKSELVSLIRNVNGDMIGQIDIDGSELNLFSEEDALFFSKIGTLIARYV